ncbi:MAG TPA: SAM-dependent chlorinase/fluorinase [Gaiellales bacterium]
MTRPVVTFLSDFGSSDPFVGICHGVIVRTCPDAEVIHLGHGIQPQSVGQGARVLAGSIPYLPVGVHMAVVDPGVGSERRAICLRAADGRLFVGPDNGLLIAAAEASGGIELAVEITESRYMLPAVSRTFHGRDVFSPVSGHLAAGLDPDRLGHRIDPGELVRLQELAASVEGSVLTAAVQQIDRFGNIQLSAELADVDGLFESGRRVELAHRDDRYYAMCALTFADVERGELVLYEDSEQRLSVAINRGNAAELVEADPLDTMTIDFEPAGA